MHHLPACCLSADASPTCFLIAGLPSQIRPQINFDTITHTGCEVEALASQKPQTTRIFLVSFTEVASLFGLFDFSRNRFLKLG